MKLGQIGPRVTFLAAAACGAALVLALAPFDYWPLAFVCASGLFALLQRFPERWRSIGVGFAAGKYGFGASWVYVSIHEFGNAPPWLAAFLVFCMIAILSLFVLIQTWLTARTRIAQPVLAAAVFAACWVVGEWVLTWLLTGFPWLFLGYSQFATPLLGFAPWGGVMLVSGLTAWLGALLVVCWQVRGQRAQLGLAAGPAVAILLLGWALGFVTFTEPGRAYRVALVQGNVEQSVKWNPESVQPIIDRYMSLTRPLWDQADLVVWPEAALTVFEHQAEPVLAQLDREGRRSNTAVVLGIPSLEFGPDGTSSFRNTAIARGTGSGRYVKRRLVPFGEYVPLESVLRGAIEFFNLPMSRSEVGRWVQPNLLIGGRDEAADALRAAMAICYEVVYPNLVRQVPPDFNVLLTISNDSWFGRSIGPLQHLQMAQMRAVELQRYVVRGTNNGVTAVIDHTGRIVDRLPQFEVGVLQSRFEARSGVTPYQRFGDLPLLLLVALVCAAAFVGRWHREKR